MSDLRTGLRARLVDDGPPLLGTFVTIPRVEVVEIAATTGFDLVVLDCEHGPFGVESLPPLIAAGKGMGLHMVVRVPDNREQVIGAALDAGADGILVPHVGSGDDAAAAVRSSRFPPRGDRSVHLWVRAAGYGADSEYGVTADAGVSVLVMAEGPEAVDNLPDVLATAEVDAVFVGPMDLAASLGLMGQPSHPRVRHLAAEVLTGAKAAGKAGAIFAPTPQAAAYWLAAGARLVVMSVDTALISSGFRDAFRELSSLSESSSGVRADR